MLKAEGLCKAYREGKKAFSVLRGVDLEIERGDVVSITGASGVGKSTLLHILGTIEVPSSGRVLFEEEDLFAYSETRLADFRNRQLGFVFQFHHLLVEFSALENVMMPLLLRGESLRKRREQAEQALADVGLADKGASLPSELSGGEQQRVAVARAIVTEPRLLLADEPTGNLDQETGNRLMELLFALNRTRQLTLVYVTHNNELAAQASRCLVLRNGSVY